MLADAVEVGGAGAGAGTAVAAVGKEPGRGWH